MRTFAEGSPRPASQPRRTGSRTPVDDFILVTRRGTGYRVGPRRRWGSAVEAHGGPGAEVRRLYDDSELTVEQIGRVLGVSRTTIYRALGPLVGQVCRCVSFRGKPSVKGSR